MKHSREIRASLALNPASLPSSWRYAPKPQKNKGKNLKVKGAQIDLLFDGPRDIVLCEIKYSTSSFVVDREFALEFSNRIEIFKEQTTTKKQILRVLLCSRGAKSTAWLTEAVDKVIDERALFKAV